MFDKKLFRFFCDYHRLAIAIACVLIVYLVGHDSVQIMVALCALALYGILLRLVPRSFLMRWGCRYIRLLLDLSFYSYIWIELHHVVPVLFLLFCFPSLSVLRYREALRLVRCFIISLLFLIGCEFIYPVVANTEQVRVTTPTVDLSIFLFIECLIYFALRAYVERERRLAELVEVLQVFDARQTARKTLDNVAKFCADVAHSEICTIMVFVKARQRLVILASSGVKAPEDETLTLGPDEGVNGRVFTLKQAINVPKVQNQKYYIPFHVAGSSVRSEIVFPLLSENKEILGTLNFESFKKDHFSDQQWLLEQLASHLPALIVFALENREQFAELTQRKNLSLTISHAMENLAHEFKNDLGIVQALCEIVERQLGAEPRKMKTEKILEKTEACKRRFTTRKNELNRRLSGDFVGLSNWRKMSIARIASTVKDVTSTHILLSGVSFKWDFTEPKTPIEITTDPEALETIITNLVLNSISAVEKKRKSSPVAGLDDLDEKEYIGILSIQVNYRVPNGELARVCICIEDNGIGLPVHITRVINEKKAAAVIPSGHGLNIVMDTLRRIRGTIEVTKAGTEGTAFEITIPDHEIESSQP